MQQSFAVAPIATVICSRANAFDDHWDAESTEIRLDSKLLGPNATAGLSDFSHIEVIYIFDKLQDNKIEWNARHPRGNTAWPEVGILAQRGKNRPNKIGATICRLIRVDDHSITVTGLDAIDGTPVIDIKPVMSGFLPRSDISEPDWAQEIMTGYW